MTVKNFRDLIVWQKAMDYVVGVYHLSAGFPKQETYGLTNQLRRAAVSIPSNIAEGHGREQPAIICTFFPSRGDPSTSQRRNS